MKLHWRSTRLFVNAGMSFPLCVANAPLLDCDKSGWPMADPHKRETVTCKNCIRIYNHSELVFPIGPQDKGEN